MPTDFPHHRSYHFPLHEGLDKAYVKDEYDADFRVWSFEHCRSAREALMALEREATPSDGGVSVALGAFLKEAIQGLLLAAFYFEAHINSFIEHRFVGKQDPAFEELWRDLAGEPGGQRHLSTVKKWLKVLSLLGKNVNPNKEPFTVFEAILDLRNHFAHARPQRTPLTRDNGNSKALTSGGDPHMTALKHMIELNMIEDTIESMRTLLGFEGGLPPGARRAR